MTLEEAIKNREDCLKYLEGIGRKASPECMEAVRWSVKALKALRPVSREQVERVWPGCEACKDAGLAIGEVQFYGPFEGPIDVSGNMHYCPNCGRPITPVAKDRQGKRLETLKDERWCPSRCGVRSAPAWANWVCPSWTQMGDKHGRLRPYRGVPVHLC